jgi:hypothetical protein
LHLAVAPAGSVLLAVEVGADFEAVDDLAAAGGAVGVAAGAAGAAVASAAGAAAGPEAEVAAAAGLLWVAFWTPPCPLQAPLPVAEEVVPSLQVVGLLDDAGAAGVAVAGAAGAAAGAVVEAAFWTPPCPLQAPFPVAEEVVPSLQVVAAVESAAPAGSDNANTINGAAMSPTRFRFFMKGYSLV